MVANKKLEEAMISKNQQIEKLKQQRAQENEKKEVKFADSIGGQ